MQIALFKQVSNPPRANNWVLDPFLRWLAPIQEILLLHFYFYYILKKVLAG
jgi:hypothetical protein